MFPLLLSVFLLAVLPISAAPRPASGSVDDAGGKSGASVATTWLSRVNTGPAGSFPPPRSFTASYVITWSDVEAARIEARCVSPENSNEIHSSIKASTTGGARLLYKLDASGSLVADRHSLRPIEFEQRQDTSGKHAYMRVEFTPQEAVRFNSDPTAPSSDPKKSKPRHFPYPGMFDMHSALLYLRSLPLTTGDEKTFPLMASNTPYLVTVRVLTRERVTVRAGSYPAIVCSLELEKINRVGSLEAHKSFKSARVWLSDDADRILLKIESEVFVGSVNLELEKITF